MSLDIAHRQQDKDEYVVGIQNPSQLISSLALILRNNSYVCLYDTSILSSPEYHIKNSTFEELNRDYLYKWFLFFKGLQHNINSYSNLIIIPEVIEEMSNLIAATLSSIDKRKKQYKSFAPIHKQKFQDIYEQLLKNEDILQSLQQQLSKHNEQCTPLEEHIFSYFLELIKTLDTHLELKKVSSRECNDTDERLAARTFYEIFVNSHNVAVYTRDDDIRKLISTTFKFLISKDIDEEMGCTLLRYLAHLNLIVLKYNYNKKVFSRFFESSTLPNIGTFRFPRKLSRSKIQQVISITKETLKKLEKKLSKCQLNSEQIQAPGNKSPDKEIVYQALENIFDKMKYIQLDDPVKTCNFQIELLDNLNTLAKYFEENGLQDKIIKTKQEYHKTSLKNTIDDLKQEQSCLQQKFDQLSARQKQGIEYWQQIQELATTSRENILKLHFFETALQANFAKATFQDFELFEKMLRKFLDCGFEISDNETPVPKEKISEITQLSLADTIKIIERYQIKHHRTHAYLTQENLLLFIFTTVPE